MARESKSIQNLLTSAGLSIPNLDGHNIRVAERRILWTKLAQGAPPPPPPKAPTPQIIELPEMVISNENVIELPDMEINPNEIEVPEVEIKASSNVKSLLKAANYLSKKINKVANQQRVVAGLNAMFRNCFNRALSVNPDTQGKVVLDLTIGADGQVANVAAQVAGNLGSAVECIKSTARTAKFDPPASGSSVVRIPVVFVKQ